MTPVYSLQKTQSIGDISVWGKLEFRNPTGTHKDRSFAYWISLCRMNGVKELAIASSGNSAISAAAYCKLANIRLHVFISTKLAKEKLARLQSFDNIQIYQSALPRKESVQFSQKNNIPNLLASKHEEGIEGYKTISFELRDQLPDTKRIFIPTSSGATLQGIYNGYKVLGCEVPELHIVQTSKVHTIAQEFSKDFIEEKESLATAIVDRVAPRKKTVANIVRATGGNGYVIFNQELENAAKYFEGCEFKPGWQSVLAFAGFLKWKEKAQPLGEAGQSVCLMTDLLYTDEVDKYDGQDKTK
ncbi:MAG: pyridoxal-phosphate dependent enzyme [Candidatus Spechtbacteria bacterium]|nr:pyridoxal-phosphate dependent enzyme [Candidatus Spechtbacteria bacterium]